MRQNFATKVLFGNLIREVLSFVNRLVLKKSVHLRRTMSLLLSICEKTRFVITLCFLCVGEAPPPLPPLRKILIRRQLLLKTHPHHRLLAMFTAKWDLGLLVEGTT